MTAPALPGAAPDPAPGRNDPARLPPEVERALSIYADAVRENAAVPFSVDHLDTREVASLGDLRTAIARALGGDGEPVANVAQEIDRAYEEGYAAYSSIHGLAAVRRPDESALGFGYPTTEERAEWKASHLAPIYARLSTRPAATGAPTVAPVGCVAPPPPTTEPEYSPGVPMTECCVCGAPDVAPTLDAALAALAALDVEPTHHPDRMEVTHTILGLDDVRAAHRAEVDALRDKLTRVLGAIQRLQPNGSPIPGDEAVVAEWIVGEVVSARATHRAEVERAVAEERALCERLLERRISDCDYLAGNAERGGNTLVRSEWEAKAAELRSALCAIRARGVAKPRTDGEASEQGAKS